jgi:ClpP class serine protease
MDLTFLIWIFILLVLFSPVIRKGMLDSARTRLLRSIEHKRGSRVIALIHRQESMAFLGFPVSRYINIEDSEQILRAIKLTDADVPLDLVLHTPGGLVLAAEQIAFAISKHPAKVTVFIPHYAMSGGTLIALAADEIVMDANAVLGPVDPQVGQYPAVSILSVLDQKSRNKISDETLILADISRKALAQMKETVRRIGCCNLTEDQAARIADELASGKWTHDYPISVEEARSLGLNVSVEMPTEIYQLMNLFPQAGQRRPSVQFIPLPYPGRQPGLPGGENKK